MQCQRKYLCLCDDACGQMEGTMKEMCFVCDIQQMKKISQFLKLEKRIEDTLIDITKEHLDSCDMDKANPEIMAEIWQKIIPVLGTDNPYKEIKNYYNTLVLSLEDTITRTIQESKNPLQTALKLVITGNLIDFAAKHTFNEQTLMEMINNIQETTLKIDDSNAMFNKMETAKTLLYLGDNCGEIVFDKIFIKALSKWYPKLKIYYGVRGKPIVNDVTIEDALEVKMHEVATVISNGDGALGTVLKNTSKEFKQVFQQVDMVICKGQGNYEGLLGNQKEDMFFLFMAKCELVASPIGVETMSIICMKNRMHLKWG